MIFVQLFAKRSIKYFLILSCVLSLIVTLVQFFERLMSSNLATINDLLYFLGIDALPMLVSIIPIVCWLTTACLLREWQLRGEWELMMLLNINPIHIFRLFCGLSLSASLIMLIAQEGGVLHLAHASKTFKHERIKKNSEPIIKNKSLALSSKKFVTIELYDKITQKGQDLTLFDINQNFSSFQSVTHYDFFSLNDSHFSHLLYNQLGTQKRIPSLVDYFCNKTPLLISESKEYYERLLTYITSLLDLLLIPPLCFILFIIFGYSPIYQWGTIISLYPLLFILKAFFSIISQATLAWVILIPYPPLLMLIIVLLKAFCEKTFIEKIQD